MRAYRQRIKNQPKKYEELKAKDRARKRKQRATVQLSERDRRRITNSRREYMKKYRQRKRAEAQENKGKVDLLLQFWYVLLPSFYFVKFI